MNIQDIRAAIQSNPEILALAQADVPDEEAISELLPKIVTLKEVYVTERGVVAALGLLDGESFLSSIESFVSTPLETSHPLSQYQTGIARQIAWLKKDGIDMGSAPARELIDTLAYFGVLNQDHANLIKGLAEERTPVSKIDIRKAIWNDDGSRAV